jgi:hypothetical protein
VNALAMLLIGVLAGVGATPRSRPETTRAVEQPLPAAARTFKITHTYGSCTIEVAGAGEPPRARLDLVASLTGARDGDAALERRYLGLCGLEVAEEAGATIVRSLFPPKDQKAAELSFAASLTLRLPAGSVVELDQSFDAAIVRGPFGAVTVRSRLGAVTVEGAKGPVTVRGESGAIVVRDVAGDATLATRSASISAERVGGHVDARNSGAPIQIDGAGSVHAENRIKPIDVAHVKGAASLVASFSSVTARDIGGDLTIEGKNSPITIERVGGDLHVQNSIDKIDARAITGSATLLGNLSPVVLGEVGGDVEVHSPNAPVKIQRVGGKVVVENSGFALDLIDLRGDVEAHCSGGLLRARFARLPADGKAHELVLEAAGGQIELELPADASATLELTSTSGQLEAEIPGIDTTQSGAARIGTAKLGDGIAKLRALCVGGPLRARRKAP